MVVSLIKLITAFGTLSGIGYYVVALTGARWFSRKRRMQPAERFRPAVSILKPLCGADPNAYESLRSHCTQDYPEFEIIFGVSDPEDVAIPIVRRLMDEFPERNLRLIVCTKALGCNYKISNLIQMLPLASYEFLLVNDSDILVGRHYLQQVMAGFENGRAGMVTSVYRGIPGRTLGSRLESLGISTDFIPGVLSARQVEGGIHFALGSTLAFRRSALESIGGFAAVVDYLGDDYELGKRISESGYTVELANCVVDHYLPDYSFSDYVKHQLRWARSTRDSRPHGYTGLVLTFGLPWAMLCLAAAPTAVWAWLLFLAATSIRYAVAYAVGLRILDDRQPVRDWWLVPIRDWLAVGIWVASFTGRRVVWRGNEFTLENGKLRPS